MYLVAWTEKTPATDSDDVTFRESGSKQEWAYRNYWRKFKTAAKAHGLYTGLQENEAVVTVNLCSVNDYKEQA